MMSKFVQIVRSSKESYWYHNKLGEIYEVEEYRKGIPGYTNDKFRVLPINGWLIDKEDCVVLSKPNIRMIRIDYGF